MPPITSSTALLFALIHISVFSVRCRKRREVLLCWTRFISDLGVFKSQFRREPGRSGKPTVRDLTHNDVNVQWFVSQSCCFGKKKKKKGAESYYFLVEAHWGAGVTAWLKEREREKIADTWISNNQEERELRVGHLRRQSETTEVCFCGPGLERGWVAIQRRCYCDIRASQRPL